MAVLSCISRINFTFIRSLPKNPKSKRKQTRRSSNFFCCSPGASIQPSEVPKRRISEQSSWEAEDSEGRDYLYRLGDEADNTNISVGARKGMIDDLFVGQFLGKDSDIVFDYRQKATRSFKYLQGDYYIAPVFLDKIGKLYETLLGNLTQRI